MATTGSSPRADATPRRRSRTARRIGDLLAVVVNVALAVVINHTPGWQSLPLVNDAFVDVLTFVNASLAAGVVVRLVLLVADPPWARRAGDAVTAAFALAMLIRLATVFPFDLGAGGAGWETPLRVLIVLACVGTAIGIVASLAEAVRSAVDGGSGD